MSVVFGGMHGLTKNTATLFHEQGHQVIIVDKRDRPDDGEEFFYDHVVVGDLMKTASFPDVAKQIAKIYGRVTNLVFGLRYRGSAENEWEGEITLGLTVPRIFIEALLPYFGDGGAVVLIGSTAGRRVTPNTSLAYQCTKAATDQMVRYYAFHLGPCGIRVNAIAPCYIVKDESIEHFLKDRDKAKRVSAEHPLGRFGRADDVAHVADFLCSEKASFVTGQILDVDGGLSLPQHGIRR